MRELFGSREHADSDDYAVILADDIFNNNNLGEEEQLDVIK